MFYRATVTVLVISLEEAVRKVAEEVISPEEEDTKVLTLFT
jgi:hypothetical protein